MLATYYDLSLNGFKAPAKGARGEATAGAGYVTALSSSTCEDGQLTDRSIRHFQIANLRRSPQSPSLQVVSPDHCFPSRNYYKKSPRRLVEMTKHPGDQGRQWKKPEQECNANLG
ncbi:unnamed protein product, partial [Iphiclides podalirius]